MNHQQANVIQADRGWYLPPAAHHRHPSRPTTMHATSCIVLVLASAKLGSSEYALEVRRRYQQDAVFHEKRVVFDDPRTSAPGTTGRMQELRLLLPRATPSCAARAPQALGMRDGRSEHRPDGGGGTEAGGDVFTSAEEMHG
jgi:hypothetical protein